MSAAAKEQNNQHQPPRLQLAFGPGSDYLETKLIPELHQQLLCFICLYNFTQELDIIQISRPVLQLLMQPSVLGWLNRTVITQ